MAMQVVTNSCYPCSNQVLRVHSELPLPCLRDHIGEILRDRWPVVFLADDVVYLAAKEASSSCSKQYSQRYAARSATSRRSAALT